MQAIARLTLGLRMLRHVENTYRTVDYGTASQQTAKKSGHTVHALRAVCRNRGPRIEPARNVNCRIS